MIAFQIHAEEGFQQEPIHPTSGTGVPRPTATTDVGRDGIDVGGDHVGFDFVGGDLVGRGTVVDRVEESKQVPGSVGISHQRKAHGGPNGAMSVLAAIFAHAGEIAFDVARIEGGLIERGIEQLDQPGG